MATKGQKYNTVKTANIIDGSTDADARRALHYCQHLTPATERDIDRLLAGLHGTGTMDGASDASADPEILEQFGFINKPKKRKMREPTAAELAEIEAEMAA